MSDIEKLTEEERQNIYGDLRIVAKALRIIDAHEADRAALVARAEAAEQKLSNMNRPLDNIERQRLYDLEAEAAALRLDNKNLQARVDATEARRVGAMAALDQVCAESAALRAELAEARALLNEANAPTREWTTRYFRWVDANPVSPHAAAERAVLEAVRRWVDGEVTSAGR